MNLSRFQESAEASLADACERLGVEITDREILGLEEPVVYGRLQGLEIWIFVDEAAVLGPGVDRRFENHRDTTPEQLEAEFVSWVIDHLTYPVYLVDRDGWMYRFARAQDLRDDLEVADVEDGEYVGWDAAGRPIVPFLRGNEIAGVEGTPQAEAPGEEALISAILNYAKIGRPNDPFLPPPGGGPDTLFSAATEHVKSGTLLGRLTKWLGG